MRRPWLALIPAIALVLIASWEIAATVRAGDDVPGDAAWAKAAALVRQRHQPGDLIVFATTVYINGTVNGDLIAAGNTIVINGTVTDDVRDLPNWMAIAGNGAGCSVSCAVRGPAEQFFFDKIAR